MEKKKRPSTNLTMSVYKFCCYIGVARSRKIGSDRDFQKNKERVQEFKVLWKKENCTLQLTSLLKRSTLTRLHAFTSRIVTSKMLNSSPGFGVDRHFLYLFSFLPRV